MQRQTLTLACMAAALLFCGTAIADPPTETPLDVEHWRAFYTNTVLVLLDDAARPGDGEAIAESLIAVGGRAPVVFGTEAVIASAPLEAPLASIAGAHVHNIHRAAVPLSEAHGRHQAESAVKYFNAALSGQLLAQLIETSNLPPIPPRGDVFSPSTSGAIGPLANELRSMQEGWTLRPTPMTWQGRNSPMIGNIRATLFFVQCQNAPECLFTWTQSEIDDVTNQTINGYRYWGNVGQNGVGTTGWSYGKSVVFTLVTYSPLYTTQVNVPYEPVRYVGTATRPGTAENYDSLWIDPIMATFGYGSGDEFSRVRAYTGAILSGSGGYYSAAFCNFMGNNREGTNKSWATYGGGFNGNGSYTYLGNFEVTLSDPNGQPNTVNAVAAHETGHVFWACDEYLGSACTCAVCDNPPGSDTRPPGTVAANINCANFACGLGVSCIMKDNTTSFAANLICAGTAQHIGWPAYPCFATVASNNWSATYYNDVYDASTGTYSHWTLGAVARFDEGSGFIDHDWGSGSPSTGNCPIRSDRFSARYQRYVTFTPGTHTFTVTSDDGVLVMVDSTTVVDEQHDQPPTTYTGSITLPDPQYGSHLVKVYYYDSTGGATLHVSWD